MHPRSLCLGAALAAALVACSPSGGGTYDGNCSTDPDTRSRVIALDASTGTQAWSRTLPHPREDLPETAGGDLLLRGCGAVVLDIADGRRLHRLPADAETDVVGLVGGYLVSSPAREVDAVPLRGGRGFSGGSTPPWDAVLVAGELVLTSGVGGLTAFAPATGDELWRTDLATSGRLSAVAAPGLLVLRTGDGSLYRVEPRTGELRWRVVPPAGTALAYSAVLAVGRTTLVAARGDAVVGLDLAGGAELWQRTDLKPDGRMRWAAVGDVAAVPTGTAVDGLDLRTGRELWQVPARSSSPVATARAFVVDDALSYLGVDPHDGTMLWRRATTHHPLLGADRSGDEVVVLDSPPVPHGRDDCC